MRKFLLYFLVTFLLSVKIHSGSCFSHSPKKYIKLSSLVRNYLSNTITETQKNLYALNIDTLKTEQKRTFFFGDYQFAGEGKLKHALYMFYKKGRLPKDENVLRCFLFTLDRVRDLNVAPDISEALDHDHEKVTRMLEGLNLSIE